MRIQNKNQTIQTSGMAIEIGESMSTFRDLATSDHNSEELALQVARIYERAQNETLALLQSRPPEKIMAPVGEWMSATQLADRVKKDCALAPNGKITV